jgi:hypothetical protein
MAGAPGKPAAEAAPPAPALSRTPKRECEVKPVMTDDDLRACGARIAE